MGEPPIGSVLKPFADGASDFFDDDENGLGLGIHLENGAELNVGHFRAAATASAHLEANRERWVAEMESAICVLDSAGDTGSERRALREIIAFLGEQG